MKDSEHNFYPAILKGTTNIPCYNCKKLIKKGQRRVGEYWSNTEGQRLSRSYCFFCGTPHLLGMITKINKFLFGSKNEKKEETKKDNQKEKSPETTQEKEAL